MPPSGFRQSYRNHHLASLRDNYAVILQEAREKGISVEVAMEQEIERLEKFLSRTHLDEEGRLVDKTTGEKLEYE